MALEMSILNNGKESNCNPLYLACIPGVLEKKGYILGTCGELLQSLTVSYISSMTVVTLLSTILEKLGDRKAHKIGYKRAKYFL